MARQFYWEVIRNNKNVNNPLLVLKYCKIFKIKCYFSYHKSWHFQNLSIKDSIKYSYLMINRNYKGRHQDELQEVPSADVDCFGLLSEARTVTGTGCPLRHNTQSHSVPETVLSFTLVNTFLLTLGCIHNQLWVTLNIRTLTQSTTNSISPNFTFDSKALLNFLLRIEFREHCQTGSV